MIDVEAVARAMGDEREIALATAAIIATLEQLAVPSEAAMSAAFELDGNEQCGTCDYWRELARPETIYRAMIQVALEQMKEKAGG